MTAALPYLDEHALQIAAPADAIWAALVRVMRGLAGSTTLLARILGADPMQASSTFTGRPGDTVPGFRVLDAEPGRRLELGGRHRFAAYKLTFVLDGDRLRALSHAAFPGVLGKLYRALVIGTGAHRIVTRRLLRQIARRA